MKYAEEVYADEACLPHWQDGLYCAYILQALQFWHCHKDEPERPHMPDVPCISAPTAVVQDYFDHTYQPTNVLHADNFQEAAALLSAITANYDLGGMYSFFRALSYTGPAQDPADAETFRKIFTEVFTPYFETFPVTEALHGASVAGHGLATLVNPAHVAGAVVSGVSLVKARRARFAERENPSLETVEKLLPLLETMQAIAQQTVDVMNEVGPVPDRWLPPVPPVSQEFLRRAIDNAKHEREWDR